ncbi:MAG: DUF4331 family protein [Armatimonadetes bacterium]|nr:DUF4331 family protein [Armatimonadota bacterium]
MNRNFRMLAATVVLATGLVTGCTSSSDNNAAVVQPANAQGVNNVQVEQLARPAINEGLLITNAFLNAYNSVSPAFVNTALTNPGSPEAAALAPIATEALATLGAFLTLSNGTGPFAGVPGGPTPPFFVGIFLPDVMRIDTTQNFPPGTSAYAGSLNANSC